MQLICIGDDHLILLTSSLGALFYSLQSEYAYSNNSIVDMFSVLLWIWTCYLSIFRNKYDMLDLCLLAATESNPAKDNCNFLCGVFPPMSLVHHFIGLRLERFNRTCVMCSANELNMILKRMGPRNVEFLPYYILCIHDMESWCH